MRVDFKIVSYHRLSPEQVSDFSVEESAVFGRSNASDWCLPDPEKVVSGAHLKIEKETDGFYVYDTSTNGVFINRSVEPLGNHSKHHLRNDDLLSIGDYEITVEIKDDVEKSNHSVKKIPESAISNHIKIPETFHNEPVEFLAQDLLTDEKLTALPSVNNDLNDNFIAPKSTSTSAIPEEWDLNLLDDDELAIAEPKNQSVIPEPQKVAIEEPSIIIEEQEVTDEVLPSIAEEQSVTDEELPSIVEKQVITDEELPSIAEEQVITDEELPSIVEKQVITDEELPSIAEEQLVNGKESVVVEKPFAVIEEELVAVESSPIVIETPNLNIVEPVAITKAAVVNDNTSAIELDRTSKFVENSQSTKSTISPQVKPTPIKPKQSAQSERNVTDINKKPVNKPKATNNANGDLSMFFKGLGLSDNINTDLISEDVIFELGQSMNLMFMGLIELLRHRASLKSEFKINQTTFQPQENNPLKFSATIDDVFNNLFLHGSRSFLSSEKAIKSAFSDTEKHDKALSAGNMGALLGVLNQLAPEQINLKNNQDHYFDKLIRANKHARNWDLYTQLHDDLKNEISTHGSSALTDEFVKAYDEKIKSL